MSSLDRIIQEVWKNAAISYEPLNGGVVNHTYKVMANGECFVLRVNGRQNDYLGLSREDENELVRLMSYAGVAPRFIAGTSEYLLTEFIDADTLSRDEMRRPSTIHSVIEILKKIHSIRGVNRTVTPFDMLSKHLEGMIALGVPFPNELNELLLEVDAIRQRYDSDCMSRKAFCHNDFYTFNILNANEKLYVIDWEISGMGDIFFDFATISFSNAFSEELDEYMLQCYFGQVTNKHHATLRDMKYMNMIRLATWGLLHSGMNEVAVNHNMDFAEHGKHTLKRLWEGLLCLE